METKTKNIMMLGGAGLAAMFLLGGKKNVVASADGEEKNVLKITKENFLPIDEGFPGYYQIMAKLYPDTVNPNYTMTDAEAQQFLDNYNDVKQALIKGKNSSLLGAARFFWREYAVPRKMTFLPLKYPRTNGYNGPGISYLTERSIVQGLVEMMGYVGTGISMFGGVDHELKPHEVDVIFNGAAIIKPILTFFEKDDMVDAINDKLTSILVTYSDR